MSKVYSISDFAKRINTSISTLRRWDASGELVANRRSSGHPQEDVEITEAQLMLYAVKQDMDPDGDEARAVIRSMRKAVKAHNKKLAAK